MIVPRHWAEARLQERAAGRQITVRRFGWSQLSQEEAQAKAEERVQVALAEARANPRLLRREPKVPHHGGSGVPIREEIVEEEGTTVIKRNSYGALCLNTPDVLFADVDFPVGSPVPAIFAGLAIAAVVIAVLIGYGRPALSTTALEMLAALFALWKLVALARHWRLRRLGGWEGVARARLATWLVAHSEWRVALYRTPAGLRLLALHRPFDPHEPEVRAFFEALATDRLYRAMCRHQRCFRARVTAKPWRIGIESHLKPRPGVWPIRPERLPERMAWVQAYGARAAGFAACRAVETLGMGAEHPAALAVQALHDRLSQAALDLPLA